MEVLFGEAGRAVDYRFIETNPAFERQTGIQNGVGRTMREIAPDHEDFWFEIYGHVATTGEARRFEHQAAALNRFYDVYAFRIGEPQEHRVAIIFNDISARLRAEEALRESEERFRLFVTTSSDTVYRMSADWSQMLSLVGKGFLSDTGSPSPTWLEEYIPAGEKAFVQAAIDEAIRSKTVFELEHRVLRGDGTLGWTLSKAIPMPDEQGETVEWFGAATDVTGRKHWEARQAFLLRLGDALGPLTDPVEIQDAVTREAMTVFGADRCCYCELIGESAVIRRDAARGNLPSVAGTYPLSSFALFRAVVEAGRPVVVHDVHSSDQVDDALRQLCLELQVVSFVGIPVMKQGRAVGILCLIQSSPRHWTDLEVELAAETAERTWTAMERTRAEAAVQASQERFRAVANLVPDLLANRTGLPPGTTGAGWNTPVRVSRRRPAGSGRTPFTLRTGKLLPGGTGKPPRASHCARSTVSGSRAVSTDGSRSIPSRSQTNAARSSRCTARRPISMTCARRTPRWKLRWRNGRSA